MRVTKFITQLNKGQKDLEHNNIAVADKDKLEHFVLQMFGSNLFYEKQMMDREKKAAPKTWASATIYLKEIVTEQEMYSNLSGRSTKKARYESAAMPRERAEEKSREESAADLERM